MALHDDLRLAGDLIANVLDATAAKSQGLNRMFIDQLTSPLLERSEVQQSMKALGLSSEDIIELLLPTEREILDASAISYQFRPNLHLWLTHLRESIEENKNQADGDLQEILDRHPHLLGALILALVILFIMWPALILLSLIGAAFALVILTRTFVAESHSKLRFAEPQVDHLRENVVLPLLRGLLNDRLRASGMDEPFLVTDASSLTGLSDREHLVTTESIRAIEQMSTSVGEGSIGVSGPRGAGKSTLLRRFCENRFARFNQPDLRILIPAPVHYEARDFVIHVFGHLCEAVVAAVPRKAGPPLTSRFLASLSVVLLLVGSVHLLWHLLEIPLSEGEPLMWAEHLVQYFLGPTALTFSLCTLLTRRLIQLYRSKRQRGKSITQLGLGETLAPLFVGTALTALVISGIARWVGPPEERFDYSVLWTPLSPGFIMLFCGAVLCLSAYGLAFWKERRAQRPRELTTLARQWISRLRYLETTTTGITGTLQLAEPAQLSGNRTRALAEQQMGLPHLVAEYRSFATRAARWWGEEHEGNGRLVVGIDEIDKMSAEEAERFVNQVKSLFGTPNCLTLVSVSDDALTHFERRSFTLRNSFDTAFDDIVRVDPLGYTDVRELLTRRISIITDPLIALCYALSGGLPRETLRVARTLAQLSLKHQNEEPGKLPRTSDFTQEIVRREVEVLKKALLSQGLPKKITETEKAWTGLDVDRDIRGILRVDWPTISAEELLRIGSHWWEEANELATYAAQFRFLGAVLVFFANEDRRPADFLRERDSDSVALLTTLARARAMGAQNPDAQYLLVEEFLDRWSETNDPDSPRSAT